jgi:hypothetical protein
LSHVIVSVYFILGFSSGSFCQGPNVILCVYNVVEIPRPYRTSNAISRLSLYVAILRSISNPSSLNNTLTIVPNFYLNSTYSIQSIMPPKRRADTAFHPSHLSPSNATSNNDIDIELIPSTPLDSII